MPETGAFARVLAEVGDALDGFARFDRPDPMTRSAEWTKALVGPLPNAGINTRTGPEDVTGLVDEIVRIGDELAAA